MGRKSHTESIVSANSVLVAPASKNDGGAPGTIGANGEGDRHLFIDWSFFVISVGGGDGAILFTPRLHHEK